MVKAIFVFVSLFLLAACGSSPNPGPDVPPPAPPAKIDPKAATAYIEVRTPEELRNLFLVMSNDSDLPEPIRSFFLAQSQSAGSGSGFVITQAGEGTLIVTNRHVVDTTDVPMVSFDQGDTQSKGKIVYVDEEYDLAVIEVSARVPGLELNTSYDDREPVSALGFPGLAGKGSYQATTGSISNRCLEESKIGGSSDHCYIQHTASIDPGSSGGPLIDGQNRVIGANVGIITQRNGVYLAVPAEAVRNALKRAETIRTSRKDPVWMTEELKTSCRRFLSGLDTARADGDVLAQAISYRLVAQKGMLAYQMTDNEQINNGFMHDPFTAMRYSLVEFLYKLVKENNGFLATEHCDQVNASDDVLSQDKGVRIMVRFGNGQRLELTWRFEHGRWRLASI